MATYFRKPSRVEAFKIPAGTEIIVTDKNGDMSSYYGGDYLIRDNETEKIIGMSAEEFEKEYQRDSTYPYIWYYGGYQGNGYQVYQANVNAAAAAPNLPTGWNNWR